MLKAILLVLAVIILAIIVAIISMQSSTKWSVGEVVRTPESQFENLPDYAFAPNYAEVKGYRIHYVDEARVTAKWFCSCMASPHGAIYIAI